jgi:chemotaxis signal transduction protein
MSATTAVVKGIRFSANVAPLVPRMDLVNDHREVLQRLEDSWEQLALLGQMSGGGTDISATGVQFRELTGELLDALARRLLQDAVRRALAKAQTAVDVLVRNLFERTADIGFLATDATLGGFARATARGDASPVDELRQRLRAYVAKYSVYDDVVLMGVDGHVLVRLDGTVGATHADATLLDSVLRSSAPFDESFGSFALLGGRRGLLYSTVVREGTATVGVLSLSFRFDDEMRTVFSGLTAPGDPSVVLLLGAGRQVLASSDTHQVPVGAVLPAPAGPGQLVCFAGRHYLAAQAPATPYQGYAGPGWHGCALVPVDLAFRSGSTEAQAARHAHAAASSHLFGDELQVIPRRAGNIQRGLERLVWNGQIRGRRDSASQAGASAVGFAGALLAQVTLAGQRISRVFHQAIGDLQQSATASLLEEARAGSALGIDILDRNLYERANDCRWWALDRTLQQAALQPDAHHCQQAAAVLAHINSLYTVYSQMLLLDANGRVLAASQSTPEEAVQTDWLAATMKLRGDQAYARSGFMASPLYGGRPTYVYAAPVAGQGVGSANAGCVAIVFDSEPQLHAMLRDALPLGSDGQPIGAAFGLLVTRSGQVVSSTHDAWPVGSQAPFADQLATLERGVSKQDMLELGGVLYAAGITMSRGYREYDSGGQCGPDDVACVVLIPLCDAASAAAAPASLGAFDPPMAPTHAADRMAIASVRIGDRWLGLPASQVVEAVAMPRLSAARAAAGATVGFTMHDGRATTVLDLRPQIEGGEPVMVLCEARSGQRFALAVDEVGSVFDVPSAEAQALPAGLAVHDPAATALLRGRDPARHQLLTLLCIDRLADRCMGGPVAAKAA